VTAAQEVMAKLMRNREALAHRRLIGVDLNHLADESGTQAAELGALPYLEP
jgi:hypothetical protein